MRAILDRVSGSSPHKWGIRRQLIHELPLSRFIPTQVGNTFPVASSYVLYAVHPHTSGEYSMVCNNVFRYAGSSPHKWGIRLTAPPLRLRSRFIPTQVGNTYPRYAIQQPAPVHPHTSGEYVFNSYFFISSVGSSPHKWGILYQVPMRLLRSRFIPTQVGNTPLCAYAP